MIFKSLQAVETRILDLLNFNRQCGKQYLTPQGDMSNDRASERGAGGFIAKFSR